MSDRRQSNSEEWRRDRPFVSLPAACASPEEYWSGVPGDFDGGCYCLLKRNASPCQRCVARAAVAEQGVGE